MLSAEHGIILSVQSHALMKVIIYGSPYLLKRNYSFVESDNESLNFVALLAFWCDL